MGVADPRDDFTSLNPAISQVYRSIHPLNQQRPALSWSAQATDATYKHLGRHLKLRLIYVHTGLENSTRECTIFEVLLNNTNCLYQRENSLK